MLLPIQNVILQALCTISFSHRYPDAIDRSVYLNVFMQPYIFIKKHLTYFFCTILVLISCYLIKNKRITVPSSPQHLTCLPKANKNNIMTSFNNPISMSTNVSQRTPNHSTGIGLGSSSLIHKIFLFFHSLQIILLRNGLLFGIKHTDFKAF